MSASCEISSKQLWMSASSTHTLPRLTVVLTVLQRMMGRTLRAKPVAHGIEVGFEDRLKQRSGAAAITTRSATVGMPSGRDCPGRPDFGIRTRRSGFGRYVPARSFAASSSRKSPTPEPSTWGRRSRHRRRELRG